MTHIFHVEKIINANKIKTILMLLVLAKNSLELKHLFRFFLQQETPSKKKRKTTII